MAKKERRVRITSDPRPLDASLTAQLVVMLGRELAARAEPDQDAEEDDSPTG